MGKKGVIMDNGRTAQSSMALYWKKNKDASKHPKQKKPEEDDKQITDKSVQSNFQKWKMHKQKLISKAYTKPSKTDESTQKKIEKDNEEDLLMERLMQSKKPKIMTIPGFKSKNELANKLQIEKPKQADQSTNVLRLPSHMESLSQEDIVQMLRERKSKQEMQKKMQQKHESVTKQVNKNDMMLADDYIDLNKKKEKDEEKEQVQEVKEPEPEPAFFKSDILNKIEKQGIEKVLVPVHNVQKIEENNQKVENHNVDAQHIEEKHNESEPRKPISINSKFLPRALKK